MLQMLREVCDHHGLRKTTGSQKFRELAKNIDVGELAERVERNIGTHTDDDTPSHWQATDAVVSHPHHR